MEAQAALKFNELRVEVSLVLGILTQNPVADVSVFDPKSRYPLLALYETSPPLCCKLGAKKYQETFDGSQAQSVVTLLGNVPALGGLALNAELKAMGVKLSPVAIKLQPEPRFWNAEDDTGVPEANVVLKEVFALTQTPSPTPIVVRTS